MSYRKDQKIVSPLITVEKETEPVKGTGIIWENNGQPPKILHRAKADEDDEERLLGWHADADILTVCFQHYF